MQPLFTLLGKQCAAPTAMSPRLQRAALLKLLAHAAYCGHAKTKKLGNFARALASLVKLQNALAHRNRYGSHEHTVLHIFPFVKLHYLWKRSSVRRKRGGILGGVGIPPMFCKRVRKPLIGKGLLKYSFLKSAEEYENRAVNFSAFLQKCEKAREGHGHVCRPESLKVGMLRAEGERCGGGIVGKGERLRVTRNGSMGLDYCQDTVL